MWFVHIYENVRWKSGDKIKPRLLTLEDFSASGIETQDNTNEYLEAATLLT